jgi:hypothetical protein
LITGQESNTASFIAVESPGYILTNERLLQLKHERIINHFLELNLPRAVDSTPHVSHLDFEACGWLNLLFLALRSLIRIDRELLPDESLQLLPDTIEIHASLEVMGALISQEQG